MRGIALRRQALVAVVVVADTVAESATSSDVEWDGVAIVSVVLALLCLAPVAFASTPRNYRVGAAVVALLLTIGSVHGIVEGDYYPIPAAVIAWLTALLPIRGRRVA